MREILQQNPDDLVAEDPKVHIYALYDLTIGASIAFLPSAFFALIFQTGATRLPGIMVLAVGITLLYEWWLNRLYGKRHSARFTKKQLTGDGGQISEDESRPIVTALYFIVINMYVFLLVLLPALLIIGFMKPYSVNSLDKAVMAPFLAAMIILNGMDATLDALHFFFNPVQRPRWRSTIHFGGDIFSCLIYAIALGYVLLIGKDIGGWLVLVVIGDIGVSLIVWFWLGPAIAKLILGKTELDEGKTSNERWVSIFWGRQMLPKSADNEIILSASSEADQGTPN